MSYSPNSSKNLRKNKSSTNHTTPLKLFLTSIQYLQFLFLILVQLIQPSSSSVGEEFIIDAVESDNHGLYVDNMVQWFYVKSPKMISYYYPLKISRDFGGPLSDEEPFSTNLILADPLNACEPLKNSNKNPVTSMSQMLTQNSRYKDSVVLAIRGDCSFLEKTLNIQNAGAVAAFIYNNEPKDEWIMMAGDETNRQHMVSISPYFVYYSDGTAIEKELRSLPGQSTRIVVPLNHTKHYINHPPWRVWMTEG